MDVQKINAEILQMVLGHVLIRAAASSEISTSCHQTEKRNIKKIQVGNSIQTTVQVRGVQTTAAPQSYGH